jgi:drug/metabolite transporter (DMT)-like permease
MRCFFGMLANVIYIYSLQYISFSEATVIYWTSPVFTSIGARYVLKENLSNFDWVAVLTAFIGIVLMQNPFQQ